MILDFFTDIHAMLDSNPAIQTAIAGAVALAISGAIGYAMRDVPVKILGGVKWLFIITSQIDDSKWERREIFNRTCDALLDASIPIFTRTFSESVYYEEKDETSDEWQRVNNLSLGYGKTVCFVSGCILFVGRYKTDQNTNPFDTVHISTFIWNKAKLISFMEGIRGKKDNLPAVYENFGEGWTKSGNVVGDTLDELTLMPETRSNITHELDRFHSNIDPQFSKLTLLLHGQPGTGKTGIVRAIAKSYKRSIYSINLSGMNDQKLFTAVRSIPKGCILLIEDCDCITATTQRDIAANSDKPPLTLAGLLNCLDGIVPLTNTIVFLTTNHIEKLDGALTRQARVDRKIHLPQIDGKYVSEKLLSKFNIDMQFDNMMFLGCEVHEVYRLASLGLNIDLTQIHNSKAAAELKSTVKLTDEG